MYFTKYPYRSNFSFAKSGVESGPLTLGKRQAHVSLDEFEGEVFRVQLENADLWESPRRICELIPPPKQEAKNILIDENGALVIRNQNGETVLKGIDRQCIGLSGEQSMWQFECEQGSQFYGMGEKNFGRFELNGIRTKFWNTDVWADFHMAQWSEHPTDPSYFSTPYLIIRNGDQWIGLLLDTPCPTYIETPQTTNANDAFVEWQKTESSIKLGNECGQPVLWILLGNSLKELTRKLQKLVGTMPMPPLWALGYHQSRWGYASEQDMIHLDEKFKEHQIPCDAIWLDIDYMDGFRLFTFDPDLWPNGAEPLLSRLKSEGRRIVPIIDPGLKQDRNYDAYRNGKQHDVFCQNENGDEFVGLVWPGETVYPDFTLPEVRTWWAQKVSEFARLGFDGCWVDMNDPSTGPVDPHGMRFNRGTEPHTFHRNQYALGMQEATRDGFLAAHPNQRPFILSRSGFTGSSRVSAIWTGDNVANQTYLRMSIPTSLNLSLSGIPMNAPDVGGFGGDTTEQLFVDWMKAGFLFPFLRNHNVKGARDQEPWTFSDAATGIVRRLIRLRYKLMPYLANLFAQHEESGDPILRPLIYEFEGLSDEFYTLDDQFMIGNAIMQAPILDDTRRYRIVRLPTNSYWLDGNGEWITGKRISVEPDRGETPLFFRNGTIVPMQKQLPTTNECDLCEIDLHVVVRKNWKGTASLSYVADDGISLDYQSGKRSRLEVEARIENGSLHLDLKQTDDGYGPIHADLVLHDEFDEVVVNGTTMLPMDERCAFLGKPFQAWRIQL